MLSYVCVYVIIGCLVELIENFVSRRLVLKTCGFLPPSPPLAVTLFGIATWPATAFMMAILWSLWDED